MSFSSLDIKQIEKKGLTVNKVKAQIETFKSGLPFSNLIAAATINDGIVRLSEKEIEEKIAYFEAKRNVVSMLKFVPASGAATRMFKFLFLFMEEFSQENETLNSYVNKFKNKDLSIFLVGIEKLPFYSEVVNHIEKTHSNYKKLSIEKKIVLFVKTMLDEDKLNYGNFPKGLLPFHTYKNNRAVTAFEEHLFEAALYASSNNKAALHFTISEQHDTKFKTEFTRIKELVELATGVQFDISFSYQKELTDTIAVTLKDKPFREANGKLLFRPSGHGALIENLNDLNADVIFVKNIDNVVVYSFKEEVAKYKKVLAGVLLDVQERAFHYLKRLEDEGISCSELIEIAEFLLNKLKVRISPEFEKYKDKYQIEYLRDKLNRPIRVCGMVKNEGEPGGGPFWVKGEGYRVSLQIVESAQINSKNKQQKQIIKSATHFNPVDLVCGVKDYKGNKFDLGNFVDPKAGFITQKTKLGKELKALELPGLWNGSMANWNTIFVEVPLITFNPVKTVNDLLKTTHQIKSDV